MLIRFSYATAFCLNQKKEQNESWIGLKGGQSDRKTVRQLDRQTNSQAGRQQSGFELFKKCDCYLQNVQWIETRTDNSTTDHEATQDRDRDWDRDPDKDKDQDVDKDEDIDNDVHVDVSCDSPWK